MRSALEVIQTDAVMKGEGNKEYRETSVATLELYLPKESQVSSNYLFLPNMFHNTQYSQEIFVFVIPHVCKEEER